ncbi:amidohydrolase family protein [Nocardiopsis lambiniae]|uniref:Amidohydrolase family protein n=1 Tax=Nocardiopsis lambiniae TaxID=3075539 RepID=A0ABU2M7A4_9ACTN|nr:amidohydrolase family protein [Nocardiopsis sp. DSM 44743]MDT0328549.1 amidohydrolase family protein [Nocardiopsis sp. DSM 44743]
MNRTLITGATVITMTPDRPEAEPADVLIEGDTVLEVGPDLPRGEAEIVDLTGRVVCPGFVNAHLHTWQTALRGTGPDWTLLGYLAHMHGGVTGRYRPEDVHAATRAGALAQLDRGTTTIADWAHHCSTPEDAITAVDALADSGIRAAFLHGTPYRDPDVPHPVEVIDRLIAHTSGNGLITIGMAAQGPQYSSPAVAVTDFGAARDRDIVVSFHQSGGDLADGWTALRSEGLFGPRVNIAHGVELSDGWLEYLLSRGVTFTSTPENELGQGHGTPIVPRLLDAGGLPSLGTDTDAVTGGDVRDAARLALALRRGVEHERNRRSGEPMALETSVRSRRALEWITTGGATALGLADRVGRISAGMRADLVVVDPRGLCAGPMPDPVGAVLNADRADVEAVMVGGAWRKRDHALVDVDVEDVMSRLARSARHLLGERNVPSGVPAV